MMRTPHPFITAMMVLVAAVTVAAKEPAELVYEKVHPAVVSLRNAEGSGTGILLDRNGLILTNAHVVMSPLRFEAKIDLRLNGTLKTETFKKVTIVGLHPGYDLALIKIDPNEHRGVLTTATLAKELPKPGKSLYAIGNPGAGDGVILTKTITSGMLSGVRQMEGQTFLQVSAAINPGNSGGPLCDAEGNVVGVVTFKITEADGIGFAIPTKGFAVSQFVPWDKRPINAEATRELVDIASKHLDKADALKKRYGEKDERAIIPRAIALRAYWLALMNSPGNARLYYSVGMVYRTFDMDEIALAYLVRAVELEPWADEHANHFREMGYALVKLNRVDEALVAWREGTAKRPMSSGKIWEDLAITHINRQEKIDAAYASKVALRLGDCRPDAMQNIYNAATQNMPADQQAKLQERIRKMEDDLKRTQAAADKAEASKRKFISTECEVLVKRLGTLADQDETAKHLAKVKDDATKAGATEPLAADPADPVKPSAKPVVEPKDPQAAWIDKKLDLADLYRSSKQTDKMKEVLSEIIDRYPDHPRTKQARDMLKRLEGGK